MNQNKSESASEVINSNNEQSPTAKGSNASVSVKFKAAMQPILLAIAEGRYEKAIKLANSAGPNPDIRNAKGVCLLRLGRIDEAVALYRDLVVNPGSTWMRSGLPTVYKSNFATALLLASNVSGCWDTLNEINEEQNPTVQRLRAAIQRWQKTLSLWQKFNWRFGAVEPSNRPVTIDFTPGELTTDSL